MELRCRRTVVVIFQGALVLNVHWPGLALRDLCILLYIIPSLAEQRGKGAELILCNNLENPAWSQPTEVMWLWRQVEILVNM